ncbi:hypothetical protein [Hymenobacter sp. B81]|uniref:hypothetical protein n=1 Tax=Hymenobacter sp. B81 TaxID=3344878 RepID=UPI0037DD2874
MKTPFSSLLLAAALLVGSAACQRSFSGPVSPTEPLRTAADRTLYFGSGSRYTGYEQSFTLSTSGRVVMRQGLRTQAPAAPRLLKVAPGAARSCFRRLDQLPTDSLQFDYPGNHYYFLESHTARGAAVRLVWGAADSTAPHAARVLYQQLQALLPPSS